MVLFLADRVPRKVALDAEQRAGLPEALRRWVRFALERRGVAPGWIEPVPAELAKREVDLTDREAVDDAIRALNAEQLARRLIQE